jgi:hypothetical protein
MDGGKTTAGAAWVMDDVKDASKPMVRIRSRFISEEVRLETVPNSVFVKEPVPPHRGRQNAITDNANLAS